MDRLRVVVADDHALIRRGTCEYLAEDPRIEVVGMAASGREAVELVERLHPDLLVTDVRMPDFDGISLTRQLKERFPELHVIILSMHDDSEMVFKAWQAGANGYVIKTADEEQLLHMIWQTLRRERAQLRSTIS